MFAVVRLGSAQFTVTEGQTIVADRMDHKVGDKIQLAEVLLVSDGATVKVGQPLVKDASVAAEIVAHPRGAKVVAFKYRKRKDSARTHGHRQDQTSVRIGKISL